MVLAMVVDASSPLPFTIKFLTAIATEFVAWERHDNRLISGGHLNHGGFFFAGWDLVLFNKSMFRPNSKCYAVVLC